MFLFSMLLERRFLFVVITMFFLSIKIKANEVVALNDSLQPKVSYLVEDRTHFHEFHKISVPEVVVPAAVVGVSSFFVRKEKFVKLKEKVQSVLSYKDKKMRADDWFQYLPMATVYGVNFTKLKGVHNFKDRTIILALAYLTMGTVVNTMKYTICEKRPDGSSLNSFPSGHTATVFMGAEFLRKEYASISPWVGYSGYLVALATGYLRIYNNRHYFNDVLAGACIGILSTKFAYWVYPLIFKRTACKNHRFRMVTFPVYQEGSWGVGMKMQF